jgi:hypothetical protein
MVKLFGIGSASGGATCSRLTGFRSGEGDAWRYLPAPSSFTVSVSLPLPLFHEDLRRTFEGGLVRS